MEYDPIHNVTRASVKKKRLRSLDRYKSRKGKNLSGCTEEKKLSIQIFKYTISSRHGKQDLQESDNTSEYDVNFKPRQLILVE